MPTEHRTDLQGDLSGGGATGGRPSMTFGEVEAMRDMPKRLDSFMSEIRQQFSTLGEQILPTLSLVSAELGRLQKTVSRIVHENRSIMARQDAIEAQLSAMRLELAAATAKKVVRPRRNAKIARPRRR